MNISLAVTPAITSGHIAEINTALTSAQYAVDSLSAKADLVGGKVPEVQLPDVVFPVTTVNGLTGDVTIPAPTIPVTSVNSLTGDVVIDTDAFQLVDKEGGVGFHDSDGSIVLITPISAEDVFSGWEIHVRVTPGTEGELFAFETTNPAFNIVADLSSGNFTSGAKWIGVKIRYASGIQTYDCFSDGILSNTVTLGTNPAPLT